MSIFGNLSSDGLEETEDRLGGGAPALETDAYTGKIKLAYAIKSSGGAQGVDLTLDFNGVEYRETVYITNKKGENWFLNKNDTSKKVPLPGFTIIDDICWVTTEKPLKDQDTEDKIVKIYDFESRQEKPQSVPVLVELLGKEVTLGIVKSLEDATKKNDAGDYVPTGKTKNVNNIEKVFHEPTKLTMVEVRKEMTEAAFFPAWVEKNKGKTRDKTDKSGATGSDGRPGKSGGSAPAATEGTARKSLFGNK